MAHSKQKISDILYATQFHNTVDATLAELEAERSGIQNGLFTRFSIMNFALMKYCRFETIFTIAGASGSGKSYLLNMLRTDFTDDKEIRFPVSLFKTQECYDHFVKWSEFTHIGDCMVRKPINANSPMKVLHLHFGFEVSIAKENIRSLSTMTGYSFEYLLSASSVGKIDNQYQYNRLTDEQYEIIKEILKQYTLSRKNCFVFKNSGSRQQIYNTCKELYKKYCNENRRLFVTLDHSLLVKKSDENGDLQMQDEIIRTLVEIRDDFGALVIPLIQMNSNIENAQRRGDPKLHYPVKSDLYMGGQFFQGSDFVATLLMPSKIGIAQYGPNLLPTNKLLHLSFIKSRYSTDGQVWFYDDLAHGKIYGQVFNRETSRFEIQPTLVKDVLPL